MFSRIEALHVSKRPLGMFAAPVNAATSSSTRSKNIFSARKAGCWLACLNVTNYMRQ